MNLSDCTMGQLVTDASRFLIPGTNVLSCGSRRRVGHVVGLSLNSSQEVIPVVHFAGDDQPLPVHHANLEPYRDPS